MPPQKIVKPRVTSVDAIRVIAIVAVIVLHTTPFDRSPETFGQAPNIATLVNQLARFAVPMFFVLSGYFWGCKMLDSEPNFASSAKSTGRLLILAFAWSVLYLLLMNVQDHQIEGWRDYARLIRSNLLAVVSQRFHIRTS